MKKILFVCPFPFGLQAGQRLKFEQHYKIFERNGFSVEYESFINVETYAYLYKRGFFLKKIMSLLRGYVKRFLLIKKLKNYDIVYIFMWVTPYFGNYFERAYINYSKKTIFDMEDNVLVTTNNPINKMSNLFKNNKKIIYLLNNVDHIITSTPVLKKKVEEINLKKNVTYICASIEIDRYIKNKKDDNLIRIGWTGTFSSISFLKLIEDVIIKISKIRQIEFVIICNSYYKIPEVKNKFIYWNKKNEINDLSDIDIGVYPLSLNNDWVIGKSGLKCLQYMAMGIPSVSTNVGNIKNIVEDGVDGYLVKNKDEWYEKLIQLIDNSKIRKKMGSMARKKVETEYSVKVLNKKYLKIFDILTK